MMRVTRFFPTVMVAALVVGCGGGQTGDLSGENDQNGAKTAAGNGCKEELTEISLDDGLALGFDARQVLAFAEQGFQTDLAWQAVDHVEYSPSASQSTLTVAVRSLDKAWLVHSVPEDSSEQATTLLGVICPTDRLRVLAHIDLQSADGALAESFDGSLDAASPAAATLRHALDAAHTSGSFAISEVTPVGTGTASVEQLSFDALLTPGGMAGALTGRLSSANAQVASSSPLTFARFPSDARCSGAPGSIGTGVPVTADNAALGQTGTEAMNQVNARGPLALSWDDNAHSTLELELSQLADGCVQVGNGTGYDGPSQAPATVVYPVVVKATSADGRLQAQLPARLLAWPSADGHGFTQQVELNQTFAANDLGATGFSGVSIPTGTQRLRVGLNGVFDAAHATGKLALEALSDPPCVTNPEPPSGNSVPPCSGTAVSLVLSGYWPG